MKLVMETMNVVADFQKTQWSIFFEWTSMLISHDARTYNIDLESHVKEKSSNQIDIPFLWFIIRSTRSIYNDAKRRMRLKMQFCITLNHHSCRPNMQYADIQKKREESYQNPNTPTTSLVSLSHRRPTALPH